MKQRIALAGKPNSGKSVVFNLLTGARQKVANYPGVTVEKYQGECTLPDGHACTLIDLPGIYGLNRGSPEERISQRILTGEEGPKPDLLLCVIEATRLKVGLKLLLTLQQMRLPMLILLNKMDQAARQGIKIDTAALAQILQIPVLPIIATQKQSRPLILQAMVHAPRELPAGWGQNLPSADELLARVLLEPGQYSLITQQLDRVLLHPVAGTLVFVSLVFLLFQTVFTWATIPMDLFDDALARLIVWLRAVLPASSFTNLLCDGILAGVGGVLVFIPQLALLFTGIIVMEDSGYMARAAVLLDALMRRVGLSGKAFIPLLSGYACAIPAIMAARVIDHPKDRLLATLVIPLTTCSARLPVYTLIIAAFIPPSTVGGILSLQGLVLFALYLLGALSVLLVSKVLHLTLLRGNSHPLLMELPDYSLPHWRSLLLQLGQRCMMFVRRAGIVIVPVSIIIWALSSYPQPAPGASEPAIYYSFISRIGRLLQPLFAPLGFNWQMVTALIPGMAAREVAISVLSTVYSVGEGGESLRMLLSSRWSLATALSFLSWYVYAPQCIPTIAVIRRETHSLRWTLFAVLYLFGLAYLVSTLVYQIARALI